MQAPHLIQMPLILETSSAAMDPMGHTRTQSLQSMQESAVFGVTFLISTGSLFLFRGE